MLNDLLKIANGVINNPALTGNATLEFDVLSDPTDVTFDDVGNPVVDATAETINLTCWLRQAQRPESDVQTGTNIDSEYFEGELVDTKRYDYPIKPHGDIIATVNGRQGLFYPVNLFDSPASVQWEINAVMGTKIAGYVQFYEGD